MIKSRLRNAESLCSYTDSASVQDFHRIEEAPADIAELIFLWNLHIVEMHLGCLRCPDSHLFLDLAGGHAFPAAFNDKSSDAVLGAL